MAASSSLLPPRLLAAKTLAHHHSHLRPHKAPHSSSAATVSRHPFLLSFPAAAPTRRLAGSRASAAQKRSSEYQFDEEDEDYEGEDEEYEGDEEEWEEEDDGEEEDLDVEAMEEEARGAAADLAKRLARELHIGERLYPLAPFLIPSFPLACGK